jgi:16S rRNA (adenine1518-N6/adenine1519-N6)-dimethyltransferase
MILQKEKVEKMVFMVQKEVADSIIAQPKTKEYTKLSVFVQLFCETKRLFNVKKGAFYPPPRVESSVIELIPYKKNRLNVDIDKRFFEFLNILFAHPRKTVKNNIKKIMRDVEALKEFLNKRPEELNIEEIYQVYSGCYNE